MKQTLDRELGNLVPRFYLKRGRGQISENFGLQIETVRKSFQKQHVRVEKSVLC